MLPRSNITDYHPHVGPLMGVGLYRRDPCRLNQVRSQVLPAILPGEEEHFPFFYLLLL